MPGLRRLLIGGTHRRSSTRWRSRTSSRAASFSSASLIGKGSGRLTVLSTVTSRASSSTAPDRCSGGGRQAGDDARRHVARPEAGGMQHRCRGWQLRASLARACWYLAVGVFAQPQRARHRHHPLAAQPCARLAGLGVRPRLKHHLGQGQGAHGRMRVRHGSTQGCWLCNATGAVAGCWLLAASPPHWPAVKHPCAVHAAHAASLGAHGRATLLGERTCSSPVWSRTSMKPRPPRLRLRSTQPHTVTSWPACSARSAPAPWLRDGHVMRASSANVE